MAGLLSAVYIRLLFLLRDGFAHWAAPRWIKPAVAGLAVGAVGILLPQVMGVGYETVESMLRGDPMPAMFLVALLAAKLVLTPTSIGGGFMGASSRRRSFWAQCWARPTASSGGTSFPAWD